MKYENIIFNKKWLVLLFVVIPFIQIEADTVETTVCASTTCSITTTGAEMVVVWAKGVMGMNGSGEVSVSLNYNGVGKDTAKCRWSASSSDLCAFSAMYSETPAAGTVNITMSQSGGNGTISNPKIMYQKITTVSGGGGSVATSTIRGMFDGSGLIEYDEGSGVFSLDTSGFWSGTIATSSILTMFQSGTNTIYSTATGYGVYSATGGGSGTSTVNIDFPTEMDVSVTEGSFDGFYLAFGIMFFLSVWLAYINYFKGRI